MPVVLEKRRARSLWRAWKSCGCAMRGGDMPVMRMKGWRGRAADIFAKHGEIAAKMKSAPGPGTTDLGYSTTPHPTKGVCPLGFPGRRAFTSAGVYFWEGRRRRG